MAEQSLIKIQHPSTIEAVGRELEEISEKIIKKER